MPDDKITIERTVKINPDGSGPGDCAECAQCCGDHYFGCNFGLATEDEDNDEWCNTPGNNCPFTKWGADVYKLTMIFEKVIK